MLPTILAPISPILHLSTLLLFLPKEIERSEVQSWDWRISIQSLSHIPRVRRR